jgi:F-type H+-transporting ATPase subunit delta
MIEGSVPRRYAKALLAIGIEKKTTDRLGEELASMAAAVEISRDLRTVLSNPSIELAARRGVLYEITSRLALSPMVKNLLSLLLERGRIHRVPDISREFRRLADEEAGRIRAEVRSAKPLGEDVMTRLKGAVEGATGKKVELTRHVDPDLLGGVVLRIGSKVYDGSIRAQLNRLKLELLEGNR